MQNPWDKHLQAPAAAWATPAPWPHAERLKSRECQKSVVQGDPSGEEEMASEQQVWAWGRGGQDGVSHFPLQDQPCLAHFFSSL